MAATLSITPGSPEPLGAFPRDGGVNFAVVSSAAEALFVCLFDDENREIERLRLPGRTGDVFHGHVAGLGEGARYGFRAQGPFEPEKGLRFNFDKLLLDPFALELDRPFKLNAALFGARIHGAAEDRADSAPFMPKAIARARPAAAPRRRRSVAWRDLVIYEMHVRGFTALHPDVPAELRGTFAGLAHPAALAHLKRLGVTAVELLPIHAFVDERHLPPLGLSNYWGYNPVAWLAPDPRLAPGGWPEVRRAVEALQAEGIVVLLDVALNHSGESDHLGPTLSLRGLDNSLYYRLEPQAPALYQNQAGCGNVLALERPQPLRLALDCLRTAAELGGFDGFRYDLASVLARGADGFSPTHPFLAAATQDPLLRDLIHVAEPWDIGWGGYQLGEFPASWGEWNDRSRDDIRRFWRGDPRRLGALAARLAGSAEIFAPRHRPLSRSVNYVAAHDGFTLRDLVSYSHKRNEANGENNRDGTDENFSWSCGVDGETEDAAVLARRQGDARALLATLFACRGVPMLTMGDELGRTQKGNNNAYAQDNALAYVDWTGADEELIDFTARLVRLRLREGALTAETPLQGRPLDASGAPDVEWLGPSGEPLTPAQWDDEAGDALTAVFYDPGEAGRAASRVAVLVNRAHAPVEARLPAARAGHGWTIGAHSADPDAFGAPGDQVLTLPPRSVVILTESVEAAARSVGVDDRVLDRLAAAAGIALDWHDVVGRRTVVSAETKRALLESLGLGARSTGEALGRLGELSQEGAFRPLPVATTLRRGDAQTLRLGGALADAARPFALSIACEDGSTPQIVVPPDLGERRETIAPDGRRALVRYIPLPELPIGRHEILCDAAPDLVGHLSIAPRSAFLPPELEAGGVFGLAAQVYGLRRDGNGGGWSGDQGIGDFTSLRLLAQEAGRAGALVVGMNPLHALYPHDPERASPYHPSDRRFLEPLAIDLYDLPPELLTHSVRAALERAAPQARALSQTPFVDYGAVSALKEKLFDVAHAAFRARRLASPNDVLVLEYERFLVVGGESLRRFALFQALERFYGATLRSFPPELATPHAAGLEAFERAHEEEVDRAKFLQFLADRQFAAAAKAGEAAGLRLGFYRDLAVGCAPDGAEAFSEMSRLMQGVSIGAPPDPLGPRGQVWGLPPFDPRALAQDGFRSYGRLIAANMAYAGVLRIDHVLGLRRLFLVPSGADGRDGAYLNQPFEALVGQVAIESGRARAAVVGEDLGTVPEGLRDALSAANFLSYRVMRFERRGDGGFIAPSGYPALSAACVATHDLPPLAGWWSGADLDEAAALGLLDDGAGARAEREAEKQALGAALAEDQEFAAAMAPDAALGAAEAAAIHGFVARSKAALMLAQTDDLTLETAPVNLPGTDRERPNWRRKIMTPVETMFALPSTQAILGAIRRWRGGAST
ncbi:glycogen debranching protein GlgX [Methylocella sp.]|uniref:glycogen debranching protein GlgX n=1 Tax=Methylocella sp. TaxID=1978226 RepID=UPI003782D9E4